jgi:hypothetical protein
MPSETIDNVMRKGLLAGETLVTRLNFEHHQWVRFRVLMAQLEEMGGPVLVDTSVA